MKGNATFKPTEVVVSLNPGPFLRSLKQYGTLLKRTLNGGPNLENYPHSYKGALNLEPSVTR